MILKLGRINFVSTKDKGGLHGILIENNPELPVVAKIAMPMFSKKING